MCIRDRVIVVGGDGSLLSAARTLAKYDTPVVGVNRGRLGSVSYTHLRAHETVLDLVCRLLLEKKKQTLNNSHATKTVRNNEEQTRQYT